MPKVADIIIRIRTTLRALVSSFLVPLFSPMFGAGGGATIIRALLLNIGIPLKLHVLNRVPFMTHTVHVCTLSGHSPSLVRGRSRSDDRGSSIDSGHRMCRSVGQRKRC